MRVFQREMLAYAARKPQKSTLRITIVGNAQYGGSLRLKSLRQPDSGIDAI